MNKPYVIGISGGSGSGKTSFIKELVKNVGKEYISVVSQDDYYLPKKKQRTDKKVKVNFDLPTAIDRELFFKDMQRLINNIAIEKTEYTFNNRNKKPKTIKVAPTPILVMEGLFIFHFGEIWDLLDLTVFLHADDNTRLMRRLKRDKEERGYPEKDVQYQWKNHVKPCYQKYLKPYRGAADLVVNNNRTYQPGLSVLTSYLNTILQGKKNLALV